LEETIHKFIAFHMCIEILLHLKYAAFELVSLCLFVKQEDIYKVKVVPLQARCGPEGR